MKKIITGMLGIVGTLALVGGVAYATVFGHVDATASATTTNDLLVSSDGGSTYSTSVDLSNDVFKNLTTVGNSKVLYFDNQTNSATTALTIQQVGTLAGDSSIFGNIQVAFADGVTTSPTTSWFSLTAWGGGGSLSGVSIPANTTGHAVTMFVRLDPTTTSNGNASYSVTGIDFDFGPTY